MDVSKRPNVDESKLHPVVGGHIFALSRLTNVFLARLRAICVGVRTSPASCRRCPPNSGERLQLAGDVSPSDDDLPQLAGDVCQVTVSPRNLQEMVHQVTMISRNLQEMFHQTTMISCNLQELTAKTKRAYTVAVSHINI